MAVDNRQNLFISGLVAVAVSGVVSLATLSLADEMMSHPPADGGGGTTQTYTAPVDSGQTYTQPSSGTTYDHPMESQPSGTTTAPSGGTTYPSGGTTYPSGGTQPGGTSTSPWPTSGGMGGQGGGMQGGSMGGQGGMTSGGMGGQGGHDVGVGGGQRNYQGQGSGGEGHGAPYGRGRWEPTPGEGDRGAPSLEEREEFGRRFGGEHAMPDFGEMPSGDFEGRFQKMQNEIGSKIEGEMRNKMMEKMMGGGSPGGMGGMIGGGMPGGSEMMERMQGFQTMFGGHGSSKKPKLQGLDKQLEKLAAQAEEDSAAVEIPPAVLKSMEKIVASWNKQEPKLTQGWAALEPKLDDVSTSEAKKLEALGKRVYKAAEKLGAVLGSVESLIGEVDDPAFEQLVEDCQEAYDEATALLESIGSYVEE